jgi:hypothetical protein
MPVRPFARAAAGIAVVAALLLMAGAPTEAAPRPPRGDRTPPTAPTNVQVTAVTETSVTVAWNPSTDNVGVVSYSLWPEGLGIGVVSVAHPQTTGTWIRGLRPGQTYTFHVTAFDAAFNRSADGTVTVTTRPDTHPPSTPTGLSVRGVDGSEVQLLWNASTDDVGPIRYEILVNGVVTLNATPGATPGTFPPPSGQLSWVRQLEPGTTYQFAVRAVDGSGNRSGSSNTVSATTAPSHDTTPPTTPTLLSANGGGTGTCPEEIWLRWTRSTDNVDPQSAIDYEIRINGTINEVQTGIAGTVAYTDVLGPNRVTIVAVDRAGNASAPSNAIDVTTNWGFGGCGQT